MKKIGTYPNVGPAALTYQIVGQSDATSIADEKSKMSAFTPNNYGEQFAYGEYTVATHGPDNLLPSRVQNMYRQNAYIPEILKKKTRIMYGKGLGLFQIREEEDKEVRIPVSKQHADVLNWVAGWDKNGLPSFREYIHKVMYDYFYHEIYYSHPRFNVSRRTGGRMPVRGLVHFSADRSRLAMRGMLPSNETIEDSMCNVVLHNHWDRPFRFDSSEYDRFNPADPFVSAKAIMPVRDLGPGEDIYPIPTGYYGLEQWTQIANLNAPYLHSFLKNSFSARKHVRIPMTWVVTKKAALENLCKKNQEREQADQDLITEFEGLKDIGTTYKETFLDKLIQVKMDSLMGVMTGEGENQGKTFYSTTFLTEYGIEKWDIEDIPTNYKDFVDSLTSVDKHALRNILAGIGMDPAITNVSNEGVFNSGAQVYYAYLVFLDTQHFAEEIILQELNRALMLNFPKLEREGTKAMFKRFAPPRQQDVKPGERMENNNQ